MQDSQWLCRIDSELAYSCKMEDCGGSCHSSWRSVTSGLIQGSVEASLVFVICTNDLDGLVIKFADDTRIAGVGKVKKAVNVCSGL